MPEIKNILTIDVEDYFQVENFSKIIHCSQWSKYESRVEVNTERLLEILSCAKVKATFFVLGWTAEKHPSLIKKIYSTGHEIASHGYRHQLVFRQKPEEFRQDLRKTKDALESIIGDKIVGYRAPTFSIDNDSKWAFDILAEEGFKYDSSYSPARLRLHCNTNNFRPYEIISSAGKIWEFPVFTGGGYFRLLQYNYIKGMIKRLNKKNCQAVIYLHPWEIDKDQPRIKVGWLSGFRHYVNLSKTEGKLIKLLNDFCFTTMKDRLTNV